MPIDINISKDGYGMIITGRALVTDDEYREAFLGLLAEKPETKSINLYTLLDWSGVAKAEVTTDSVRLISDLAKHHPSMAETKLIVGSVAVQDYIYGLARMGDMLKQSLGWTTAIFRTRTETEDWISMAVKKQHGIDTLVFEPAEPARLEKKELTE